MQIFVIISVNTKYIHKKIYISADIEDWHHKWQPANSRNGMQTPSEGDLPTLSDEKRVLGGKYVWSAILVNASVFALTRFIRVT